ncbi:DUF4396 domain-containing protein [Celerinatantimonas yamalensis]|uniref:DUF4396 domain-containing protein n=1 Tax=Celerinatantimonas yamalensis TaxID=559956 RepID=A0ABW9G8Y3_9GAMM
MIPIWLSTLAWISIGLGGITAIYLRWDTYRHPQHMAVMNWVWPLCALFGHLLIIWFYLQHGRASDHSHHHMHHKTEHTVSKPTVIQVSKGVLHCGSGCTLGDIIAESLVFFVPTIAVWFGWQTVFADKIFAIWIVDFILAFIIGIIFQYLSIKPMRQIGVREAFWAALKADFLSLASWQVGMYGFMAFAHFYWFAHVLKTPLVVDSASFWLMIQLAMYCGFVTAFPVNYALIRSGVKEVM